MIYSIAGVLSVGIYALNTVRYSNELSDENFELSTPWKEIQISIRTLKGILDTYMFIFFVKVFFHLKREKESKAKKQISPL